MIYFPLNLEGVLTLVPQENNTFKKLNIFRIFLAVQ
jgi:hypothetical protein